jgi:hypothetical protein
MENQILEFYVPNQMTHVSINENSLENYHKIMDKKRMVSSCTFDQVTRVTTGLSFLEEKQKLVIYYTKEGKEKRFGGIGFSLEGNLSDPEFANFLDRLKAVLPASVQWEEKASAKKVKTTADGGQAYPLTPVMNMLLYKRRFHSGERIIMVSMMYVFSFILAPLGLFMVVGAGIFETKSIGETAMLGGLGGALAAIGIMPLMIGFKKGGLYTTLLNDEQIQVNFAYSSKILKLSEITTISVRKTNLTIKNMDNYNKTNSVELDFTVNNSLKFTMGESTGFQFIEALKEKGKEVEGA